MTELIEEYIANAETCVNTQYDIKSSVKKHNKAVDRMYAIVTLIDENAAQWQAEFLTLLDISEYNINQWVAIHSLEKLDIDSVNQNKALKIIKQAAKEDSADGLGFEYWLQRWYEKKK